MGTAYTSSGKIVRITSEIKFIKRLCQNVHFLLPWQRDIYKKRATLKSVFITKGLLLSHYLYVVNVPFGSSEIFCFK